MVREANAGDTSTLALMLKKMSVEMMPEYATDNDGMYWATVMEWLEEPNTYVFVDNVLRGFFVVIDDSEDIFPDYHRYVISKVYIEPQYRKTKLYSRFFNFVYEEFTDGDVIGVTEIGSDHIPVLEKRHERIANVYRMTRKET